MKKPTSSDPEQRRHDTRVSRFQSGLPPEEEHEDDDDETKREEESRKTGAKPGAQGPET
jgi:hypothetical protein